VRCYSLLTVATSVVALMLASVSSLFSQAQPAGRVFKSSKTSVEAALQRIHSSASGRLPTLDGFVDSDQSLDAYSKAYYQCKFEVSSTANGTMVSVTAKITAWYAGSAGKPAAYQVLPSNGRLEADFLDRLADALGAGAATSQSNAGAGAGTGATAPAAKRKAFSQPSSSPGSSASPAPLETSPNSPAISKSIITRTAPAIPSVAPPSSDGGSAPAAAGEDLKSLRQRRQQAEADAKRLSGDIQDLEDIQKNQSHPSDLVVVKRPDTTVFGRPSANAPVLFHADAEDEFQIIEREANWVHVQISGESRGWIKREDVDMPDAFGGDTKASNNDAVGFRIAREETKPFPGDWEPLHGKTVRIFWVEPLSPSGNSSADDKRSYAKTLFLKAYQEITTGKQPVDGVVVVFDSADGGQISATMATLKDWQAGNLPDASFWKQCALDPPELLQNAPKGSAEGSKSSNR
jgi:hypothetical protein